MHHVWNLLSEYVNLRPNIMKSNKLTIFMFNIWIHASQYIHVGRNRHQCQPVIPLTVTYTCAYLFRDTVNHKFQIHLQNYLIITKNKTLFEATIVVIFIIYCEQWCCELWCCIDHLAAREDSPLAGCLRQGQSLVFTSSTINFIMRPKRTAKKIECKQPDIKLPLNIDTSKLGVESKQVVSCIITYFTEMFEKTEKLKNYWQMCPCSRHVL